MLEPSQDSSSNCSSTFGTSPEVERKRSAASLSGGTEPWHTMMIAGVDFRTDTRVPCGSRPRALNPSSFRLSPPF